MIGTVLLLASLVPPTQAADASGSERVSFHFQRADAPIKEWQIDWEAHDQAIYREGADGLPVPLHLSDSTKALLLGGRFVVAQKRCETREKHIAQTGRKEITYVSAKETLSCAFNFSDEEALNRSADTFIALAQTVQLGNELARRHRFDRLGLDAEVDFLAESLQSGRALEVENIAPILRSIAEDDRVMERVRRKAARLLDAQ